MGGDRPKTSGVSRGRIHSLRRKRSNPRASVGQVMRLLGSRRGMSLIGIGIATLIVFTSISGWARQRTMLAAGRVAPETILARVHFQIDDPTATEDALKDARDLSPRVYVALDAVLDDIRTTLLNLPKTLEAAESIDEVDQQIVERYGLTPARLAAIKGVLVNGEPTEAWRHSISLLHEQLLATPMLDAIVWQQQSQNRSEVIQLRAGAEHNNRTKSVAINIGDEPALEAYADHAAGRADLTDELRGAAVSRLTSRPTPTYRFDESETLALAERAASEVQLVRRTIEQGSVLVRKGNSIKPSEIEEVNAERRAFHAQTGTRWGIWFGSLAAMAALLAGASLYVFFFCPRIRKSAARVGWIGALGALTCAIAVVGSISNPSLLMLLGVAPTMLFAVLIVLAYDQKTALALGVVHALGVGIALRLDPATMAVLVSGVAAAVFFLPEVRERRTLVRMGVWSGLALGVLTAIVSFGVKPWPIGGAFAEVEVPIIYEIFFDAGMAGLSGLLVAGLSMFLLPSIERAFNITTGLTLMELRDPKQALLKELQRRAPGTYNHSLHVASIAEDAADAIGARSLLTYVGALYHDIGKMNKPEYFVENQGGGRNKHDKLSPAMSLLVIVGHVKDGVELAKEFNLPKPLHHFIEAHHGTTLVEYFYHRARSEDEGAGPAEFDYRYPGPKPSTKEAAILMLSDSIESATRTLKEPTPSRIDALVREIATKRLLDGQFDECGLTLRELNTITRTISKSVASIYHGRISYPTGESRGQAVARQRA